ncbi:hypothetical protein ACSBR1_005845 [Camellia fascicularis]
MKGVGQRFAQGAVEFRDALSNVHARVENYSKAFVIKQFDDIHTCGSSFRTVKHARMTSSMIGGLISSDIRNKALTSVSEVVCDFKDYYGIEVSYRQAWMGVEKARGIVFGDYSASFDDLRWYIDAANDCNSGIACIHGFKYCRPVLMLDGTFLKRRHKGCLLAATAKDGNQRIFCIYLSISFMFALVDSESYDSWHWFLAKLLVILTPGRDIAFVTDRHRGLLKALAEAPTIELFNELFEEFKGRCGRSVEKFLEDLPNEFMVDIRKRSYSCRLWEIDSFPCKHGFCAIKRSGKDLNCFLDDYYRVSSYYDSYSHSIYPVPSMWKPNVVVDDDVVLLPLCKRLARRPRTERIPSKGEIKRIRCSRCGKMGTHNRKT